MIYNKSINNRKSNHYKSRKGSSTMTEKKKRNIIIGALCTVLLLMAVGYAAFSSILNIKGTTNISSNWDIRITNVESKNVVGSASNAQDPDWDNLTATFKTNLEVPGDSIEYDVTVENKGTLNAKLDKINMTSSNNPAIKFTTTGLTEGDKLGAGSSAILTVKVEYLTGVEVDNENLSANLTVTLDYVQSNVGEGGIATIPGSDTLLENVVTEGDGLYEDPTEAGRYVYRGTDPDNYITFNGETAGWRIISVESDGTLKIMKTANLGNRVFEAANTRTAAYCNYNSRGCNVWGSVSTMLDASGNSVTKMPTQVNGSLLDLPTEEAQMTKYLNNDYYGTLNEEAKGQIDNHLWNVGPLDNTNQPLETSVQKEKAYKWRGKIGLINSSDYVRATTDESCTTVYSSMINPYPCKNDNYMYQSSYNWWTMSPFSSSISCFVWYVYSPGPLGNDYASFSNGVRPVIYLQSDISLEGSGTASDPYTIK